MELINFYPANCKSCYKCLRTCPVKAIKFKNDQAQIVEDMCIHCGQCLVVCPQNARKIESDIDNVKQALKMGRRVIVSIAPSFPASFDMTDENQMPTALKKLGFFGAEETAIGAEYVSELYRRHTENGNYENIITTSCPSANNLIEKYFPSLTKYMLPVVSPMLAHGRLIKRKYGKDTYVVFIGPCFAKKFEAMDFQKSGDVDAVLTFEELISWFHEEDIEVNTLEPSEFLAPSYRAGCAYPISGGVSGSFMVGDHKYDTISANGTQECMELLSSLERGDIKSICAELSACKGSCIGGPASSSENMAFYKRKKVKEYVAKKQERTEPLVIDNPDEFTKCFFNKSIKEEEPTHEDIVKILQQMGKFSKEDELNCGVCGYDSCRDKARAVYKGMAEVTMCMGYMRNKAESIKTEIFENSPNIIMLLDQNLNVAEFNPSAEKAFSIGARDMKGKPVSVLFNDEYLKEVVRNKKSVLGKKMAVNNSDLVIVHNAIYLEKYQGILLIMNDITWREKSRQELESVREKTIEAAQSVIDKQMMVAQEIASLLGETTAETRSILNKLKRVTIEEREIKV